MQKIIIPAVLLLLSAVNICGQSSAVKDKRSLPRVEAVRKNQETLAIGAVELRLGMPQDVVLGELAHAGYNLKKTSEQSWFVQAQVPGGKYRVIGGIGFRDGYLTFINRSWDIEEDTDAGLGNALFGVLSSLYSQGRSVCSLQTNSQQNPQSEMKTIYLTCMPGTSYVSVSIVRYEGQESVSVEEILNQR